MSYVPALVENPKLWISTVLFGEHQRRTGVAMILPGTQPAHARVARSPGGPGSWPPSRRGAERALHAAAHKARS